MSIVWCVNFIPYPSTSAILTAIVQEDSVLLWKEVCSNKLLAKVDLVLFLNKCDILESKLKSGVRLQKYVRSFGERPNDPEVAQKCGYLVLLWRSMVTKYQSTV